MSGEDQRNALKSAPATGQAAELTEDAMQTLESTGCKLEPSRWQSGRNTDR